MDDADWREARQLMHRLAMEWRDGQEGVGAMDEYDDTWPQQNVSQPDLPAPEFKPMEWVVMPHLDGQQVDAQIMSRFWDGDEWRYIVRVEFQVRGDELDKR